ncbi:MAG: hypothetical protein ABIP97_08640 [Chthoniobacterales bacterium]
MVTFKTQNEKRLVILLSSLLGLVILLVLCGQFFHYRNSLKSRLLHLRAEKSESRKLLAEQSVWEKRRAWLDDNQPKLKTEPRQESLAFLEFVEQQAKKAGVEVSAPSMLESRQMNDGIGLPVRIEGSGSTASVIGWLHQLENPRNFILVNELTIKTADKTNWISCTVELVRCYQSAK